MSLVKIVNKANKGTATVDPALAEVLIAGGAWLKAKPASKPKPEPKEDSPEE